MALKIIERELITDTAQIAAGATVIGSSIKEEKPVIDVSKKQLMKKAARAGNK